ncbi:hypothetical protein H4R20_004048, partial [Coemansia guatemalensis]
ADIVPNLVPSHGGGNVASGSNIGQPQFILPQPANLHSSLGGLGTAQLTPGMHTSNNFTHSNLGAPALFNAPTIMTADASIAQPTGSSIDSVIASLPIFSSGPAVTSVASLSSTHSPMDSLAQHYFPLQSQNQVGLNQYASNSNLQSWDEISALLGGTQSTAPMSVAGSGGVISPLFGEQNLQQLANSAIATSQPNQLPYFEGSLLPSVASSSGIIRNPSVSADTNITSSIPDIEVLDTNNPFAFTSYTTPRSQ